MNEIKVFNNPEFGELRTTEIDGEPWFVGKDVAEALGYSNPRDAISKHVDEADKASVAICDGSQNRMMATINESGMYSLIFGSKLEGAKRFKRWVTSEVLPSIRRNGGYIAGQESMSDDQLMAQALLVAQRTIESRQKLIQEMQPKALFADAVAASKTSILVGDLAKLLRQNGYETGQKRLFRQLRDEGYLIRRKGADYNSPTQYAMELGLFEIKESSHVNSDGVTIITKTPKVTGKGQIYFINRFCGEL